MKLVKTRDLLFLASPEWISDIFMSILGRDTYMAELITSISTSGILEPLEVSIYNETASLSEGHHRLVAALLCEIDCVAVEIINDRPNEFLHGVSEATFRNMLGEES